MLRVTLQFDKFSIRVVCLMNSPSRFLLGLLLQSSLARRLLELHFVFRSPYRLLVEVLPAFFKFCAASPYHKQVLSQTHLIHTFTDEVFSISSQYEGFVPADAVELAASATRDLCCS